MPSTDTKNQLDWLLITKHGSGRAGVSLLFAAAGEEWGPTQAPGTVRGEAEEAHSSTITARHQKAFSSGKKSSRVATTKFSPWQYLKVWHTATFKIEHTYKLYGSITLDCGEPGTARCGGAVLRVSRGQTCGLCFL